MPEAKDIGGVQFTRVTGPFNYLREQGYPVDWMPYTHARLSAAAGRSDITAYDIYVTQRAGDVDGRMTLFCEYLRQAGKIVVWETDDDYSNEYLQVLKGDAFRVAQASTALTVSTPHLREQMEKHVDRPVYLLQNCIDLRFWDSVQYKRIVPSPSIGLIGTPTHYDDWQIVAPVLERIAEEYPAVHFVVGGFLPDYLQDLPRLHYLEPCPYRAYPAMVHQVDIGLAPLIAGDKFNWSKSAIKAMEYWCSGAAVVASNAPPYQRVVNGDTGFLADNDDRDDWYRCIKALLDCPNLRTAMAADGRKWVARNRSMKNNAILWWAVYEELFKKYGGNHERIISQRPVGHRPTNGEGGSGDHLLPIPRTRRPRGRSHPHRAHAARGKRRPNR